MEENKEFNMEYEVQGCKLESINPYKNVTRCVNIKDDKYNYPKMFTKVGIKFRDDTIVPPSYAHTWDACADIRWNDPELDTIQLFPNTVYKLKTGLSFQIPKGYKILMSIRSGMAVKGMIMVTNPGIIDSGYQEEVAIVVTVLNNMIIKKNDRIAQISIERCEFIEFTEWEDIDSERKGGFGHTGLE